MATNPAATRFFFGLLLVATVLLGLVVRPLASALFLAAVLAGVLFPLHQRLARRIGDRPGLSAALWVLGVVIVFVVPLVAFSTFAIKEAMDGWRFLTETLRSDGINGLIERLPDSLARLARQGLQHLPTADGGGDLGKQMGAQGGKAAAAVGATLAALGGFVFQAIMMLIAFYFLLLQGPALLGWLDDASPLGEGRTHELLRDFKKTAYAVVVSTIVTAAVQAVAALIGYLIARVPHPFFFTAVTFFMAFIPAVGAGSVGVAAALLLFATGHSTAALFLAGWALLVVGLVDNLVKPILIKSGMQMQGGVVFFSLIGGLAAFGGVGLLLGPLIVSFFLALVRMYERDFRRPAAG